MSFKDKVNTFFWVFFFIVILLQLSTSKEIHFTAAFLYAISVVLSLWLYIRNISLPSVKYFLSNLNLALLFVIMSLFCCGMAFVLLFEGYLILKLSMPDEVVKLITEDWLSIYFGIFSLCAMVSGMNYSFDRYIAYLEQEKELEKLKRRSLEMEISLLRNQLSPHFTFNILNNLQFLIRKDKNEALHLLARYSKILRYYVYKSQKKQIDLSDEVAFLKEYFDLEMNRHVVDLKISCNWNIPENDLKIVPFILSAFVENAFKHVLPNEANEYYISQWCILQEHKKLIFGISNATADEIKDTKPVGVGLKHVRERLDLAYPKRYQLDIHEDHRCFNVRLELNLEK